MSERQNKSQKPYCEISEMLGEPQPERVYKTKDGNIVSVEGKLNVDKLVKKAIELEKI